MMEFIDIAKSVLDETIGVDWATYLGLFLALIGLFFTRKIIKPKNDQKATATENATVIQSGGDSKVTIIQKPYSKE
ncbi:hypothetical protein [Pseudoalteromonas xiamenensis]